MKSPETALSGPGRLFWRSLTALVSGLALMVWYFIIVQAAGVVGSLSNVLLPLALAAILACLLDPVVTALQNRLRIPRSRAILLVFFLAVMLVLILLATVIPQLIYEIMHLVDTLPATIEKFRLRLDELLKNTAAGVKLQALWSAELEGRVKEALPAVTTWLLQQVAKAAGWLGFLAGLALVPVYLFYFLLEKSQIVARWQDYLPLTESRIKEEVVYVLRAFNDCLVAFFRGQVLVALCMGAMLTAGYLALGLNYALLLGALAALLGIIPYLGYIISVGLALIIAVVQFGDWWHPALLLAIFAAAQAFESLYISPKIIGDRVGLHPVVVIVAILAGTTLMGGVIGGLLAIPLAAALRAILARYVWKRQQSSPNPAATSSPA
ncbi:MAG: AI-2E family transporter [Verrucomicrobiae bacterium]|nr:AI-2E family transporter [Verrucomicrobiae bacterium]